MLRPIFLSLLLLVLASAFGQSPSIRDSIEMPCRQKAGRLLDETLGFMEKNYYRRGDVSWPVLAAEAKARLREAVSCEDAYATISWCFHQLNEPHSFIMPPDKASRYTGESDGPDMPLPDLSLLVGEIRGEWLQDSIAYLTIPWVSSTDSLVCLRIADSLQTLIARLDSRNISRWIIDLRKNSGGNCWPMLAGIGPLLGDGVYGYFVSGDQRIPISYRDGSAFPGPACSMPGEQSRLQDAERPQVDRRADQPEDRQRWRDRRPCFQGAGADLSDRRANGGADYG
ncbi:S41 family peptidase [Puia sp. P3]|uniref:S41 family peptidase n=1 Tax=Puia sp. P3 TaxID=3423952 RepID=UPI003D672499